MGGLVARASIARMLDEVAAMPAHEGVLLTFDDFLTGVETFGEHIGSDAVPRPHPSRDEGMAS
ncbi:hypothetical protein ACNKHS_06010 [Shigella flexneri]